jgi:hypothetical protein
MVKLCFRIVRVLLLTTLVSQTAASSDWKYIGNSVVNKRECYVFYDDSSRHSGNLDIVSVQLKLLSIHFVDSTIRAWADSLVPFVRDRLQSHSIPTYNLVKADTSITRLAGIIKLEVVANRLNRHIGRVVDIELACKRRLVRTNGWMIVGDGQETEATIVTNPQWEDVASAPFGELLLELACSKHRRSLTRKARAVQDWLNVKSSLHCSPPRNWFGHSGGSQRRLA